MKDIDDKLIDKIYGCINEGKINAKEDLKLFGITDPHLQKQILWGVFEERVLKTPNTNTKHKIIQIFHRANLL